MADDLSFLDLVHPTYDSHKEEWQENERRLEGGKPVREELVQFESEDAEMFKARKKWATYVGFGKSNASVITGQLRLHGPTPEKGLSFGELGEIRTRDQIDEPSLAELAWYNVDGIGQDGSEWPAWTDDVDIRAQGTGHRWLMVEAPRADLEGRPSTERVIKGLRLFAVERSPLSATYPHIVNGQLQWIVFRDAMEEPDFTGQRSKSQDGKDLMYYLLVREGYTGLGGSFQEGGWWRFDPDKKLYPGTEGHRRWVNTQGQIPAWPHYGQKSRGTTERPAWSRSTTTELDHISVSLMQILSARDYDYWRACESVLLFLGANPDVMTEVAKQKGNIWRGVPFPPSSSGGEDRPITVYDASEGAITAEISKLLVDAKFNEAREQSFQVVTSTPDNSGRSKEAGFNELKAPYLATRAALRQQSENTMIYFWELRSGFTKPRGYSVWPRGFDLAPLVDAIDAQFTSQRLASISVPKLDSHMLYTAALERGLIPAGREKEFQGLFEDAAQAKADSAQAARDALAGLTDDREDTPQNGGRPGVPAGAAE